MLRLSFLVVLGPLLWLQVSCTQVLCAQTNVTSKGTVKFGGQPLPGATVITTQGSHRAVTTTDESGNYELPDLAPGTYTLEVQMFGFQTAHKEAADWFRLGQRGMESRSAASTARSCGTSAGGAGRATGRLSRHCGKRGRSTCRRSPTGHRRAKFSQRQRSLPGEWNVKHRPAKWPG